MATTLITGGLGFLGSHLTDRLLAEGDRVLVLDDLSTGRRGNLAQHEGVAALEIFIGSILDAELVDRLVGRADRVFHLAAVVGVGLVASDSIRLHDTNTLGTSVVLKACVAHGRPVLVASTSEVYGKSTRTPFSEDDDLVLGPTVRRRWAYACSKATGEFLAHACFRSHGLPVTVARFFNAAGPRQTGTYGMVIPRFVDQALAGDPITVYGDGFQERCFCDVLEAVKAAALLLAAPEAHGAVVNVGGTETISIRQLAELVKRLTGSASAIEHQPFEQAYGTDFDDIVVRRPDCSRLQRLTGFVPGRPLEEIVGEVIAHRCASRTPS